jgi:hypothetical protein
MKMNELFVSKIAYAGRRSGVALAVCLLLLVGFLWSALVPVAYAADRDLITIDVDQSFTGSGAENVDGIFNYRLIPETPYSPMPAGGNASGYDFTVTGSDRAQFSIDFTRAAPGTYSYEIRHASAAREGYTYDTRVYTLRVFMGNSRLLAVLLYTPDGSKTTAASFEHSYEQPPAPYSPPPVVTPPAEPAPPARNPVVNVTITPPYVGDTTVIDSEDPAPTEDTISDLRDIDIPLGNLDDDGAWSLFSLIFSILALISAAFAVPSVILERGERSEEDFEVHAQKRKTSVALESVLILLGLITLAMWMIFDDTSKPMAWVNDRTLIVAIPFIVQTALRILRVTTRLREKQTAEPPDRRVA